MRLERHLSPVLSLQIRAPISTSLTNRVPIRLALFDIYLLSMHDTINRTPTKTEHQTASKNEDTIETRR